MKHKIAMFKNDKKQSENQPDYKGFDKDTGNSIAGWIKNAKNGTTYMSIVFETGKQGNHSRAESDYSKPREQTPSQSNGFDSFDDDSVPF